MEEGGGQTQAANATRKKAHCLPLRDRINRMGLSGASLCGGLRLVKRVRAYSNADIP